jgi:imidazolonepropionase-like amidohydrolase
MLLEEGTEMMRHYMLDVVTALAVPAVAWAQGPWPPARAPVPGAPAGVTAFVDVAVVPMDTERVLPNQTVLVQNGWITALGPTGEVPVPANAARIDGRGRYLIPGLADMHAHISEEEGLFQWLAHGVTTLRDVSSGKVQLQQRADAAAGTLWSPRIYAGAWVAGPHAIESVTHHKTAGYDFLKVYEGETTADLFDSLIVTARRAGLPVAGHVPRGVPMERALASGIASIEHLTGYFGEQSSDRSRSLSPTQIAFWAGATKRGGVWNCPTFAMLETIIDKGLQAANKRPAGFQRDSAITRLTSIRSQHRQLIKALQDSGAGLLLGVDAGATFGGGGPARGSGSHDELQALVRAGLTPYQALLTGTRNVAAFFQMLDESGTVSVGKRADLVLVGGNPLADIRHTTQVAGVMIGGRWLSRAEIDRRLTDSHAAPRRGE